MNTPRGELGRTYWVLERVSARGAPEVVPIRRFPFVIGRESSCDLPLHSGTVSKTHARIEENESGLLLTDLESTNGTHVNGERILEPIQVDERDIIHFGELEFRVRAAPIDQFADGPPSMTTMLSCDRTIVQTRLFLSLLNGNGVLPHFQPIVDFREFQIQGFEVLGRARLDGLPESAAELFHFAARIGAEAQLSEVFRSAGIREGSRIPRNPMLFVNTHPAELTQHDIVATLREFRQTLPSLRLVLEIHEAAVVDLEMMRKLRNDLTDLGVGLAYDDFGAGEGRLSELAEAPPNFLKFDRKLIQGLHRAAPGKQKLVKSLVDMAHDLNVSALAECIETREERDACKDAGFDFAQGYLFGKPGTASQWSTPGPKTKRT